MVFVGFWIFVLHNTFVSQSFLLRIGAVTVPPKDLSSVNAVPKARRAARIWAR